MAAGSSSQWKGLYLSAMLAARTPTPATMTSSGMGLPNAALTRRPKLPRSSHSRSWSGTEALLAESPFSAPVGDRPPHYGIRPGRRKGGRPPLDRVGPGVENQARGVPRPREQQP